MVEDWVVRLAKGVAELIWDSEGSGWVDLLGNTPNQSNRNG